MRKMNTYGFEMYGGSVSQMLSFLWEHIKTIHLFIKQYNTLTQNMYVY